LPPERRLTPVFGSIEAIQVNSLRSAEVHISGVVGHERRLEPPFRGCETPEGS